jgi:hypothetical protein
MLGSQIDVRDIPDAIDPAVGHRSWHLHFTNEGFTIASPDRGHLWPAGQAIEAAFSTQDAEERADSNCGINAWDSPERIRGRYSSCAVQGTVKLWGEVRGYEKGWRGQFAYPAELSIPGDLPDAEAVATELTTRYGVPVSVRAGAKLAHHRSLVPIRVQGQRQLDALCARYPGAGIKISYTPQPVRGIHPEQVRVPEGWEHPIKIIAPCIIAGHTIAELDHAIWARANEHAHVHLYSSGDNQLHAEGDAVVHTSADDRPPGRYSPAVTLHERAQAFMSSGAVSLAGESEATISHCVIARAAQHSTVYARGRSVVHASDEAIVHASGLATVYATPGVTVHLSDEAVCHRVPAKADGTHKRNIEGLPDT